MTDRKEQGSGSYPEIRIIECKGCGRCILACPVGVLSMSERLNERGYRFAEYAGEGCTGCAQCYYTCPEPSAIAVHVRRRGKPKEEE